MSKHRDENGKYARKASAGTIALHWLGGLVGIGASYGVGRFLESDLSAFRSCSHNDAGLYVSTCGKQGLNLGDVVLIVLFLLAVAVTFTLFERAWKLSRRSA